MSSNQNKHIIKLQTRRDLYKYFNDLGYKTGCEVGVKAAANAWDMFSRIDGLRLYLVEPYYDYGDVDFKRGHRAHKYNMLEDFNRVNKKKHKFDVRWIIDKSERAHEKIPDECLDFVYIDGNHSYDYCMLDLILYSRKVKPGGIVSGHDYNLPGVVKAVNDFVRAHEYHPIYLTERDANISFYFFKGE
jgi:hypothetical protein